MPPGTDIGAAEYPPPDGQVSHCDPRRNQLHDPHPTMAAVRATISDNINSLFMAHTSAKTTLATDRALGRETIPRG